MDETTTGFALPDLTHPHELVQLATGAGGLLKELVLLLALLGLVFGAIAFVAHRRGGEAQTLADRWLGQYGRLVAWAPHVALVALMAVGGGWLTFTLANRAHHWEQAKLATVAETVEGERFEQPLPTVTYTETEPYTVDVVSAGKLITAKRTREVERQLNMAGSRVAVDLTQDTDPAHPERTIYGIDFKGAYDVVNPSAEARTFTFTAPAPIGYTLLSDFRIRATGGQVAPIDSKDQQVSFTLGPKQKARFELTYKAQGGPRWIYDTQNAMLSDFELLARAHFGNAQFASGIRPTEVRNESDGTTYRWAYQNVAVRDPLGVFTATAPSLGTGVLPRALILAPGVFLWWLLLVYGTAPLRLGRLPLAGVAFFAAVLALAYMGRMMPPLVAWAVASAAFVGLAYALGDDRRGGTAMAIAAVLGVALPLFALLVPFTGLTLSLAALASAAWLTWRPKPVAVPA